MRRLIAPAAALLLFACSQPAQTPAAPPPTAGPAQTPTLACNDVAPDAAAPVQVEAGALAAAALPPDLPGGPITPGVYDLRRIQAVDDAPAWTANRPAALAVTEGPDGVVFNWADAPAGAAPDRWTASFREGPPAQLNFSCGRSGAAPIAFSASAAELRQRLPAANGEGGYQMVLARRT
ncbi:MAG: hypothetical protein AB7L65_00985 [Hyphomonadaceae bacterium]